VTASPPPRLPERTAPARIGDLATLPLFHKLKGRRVLLAGDGDGAVWKAELVAAAGAALLVCAPDRPEAFAGLAGDIRIEPRGWRPADMAGAALVIAEAGSDGEAEAIHAAARAAGVPVNVIDRPAFCDFQFGALVNRSPLVVAISTDGAAPVFGQAIRARIEAALPPGLKAWAEAARRWRPAVQARSLPFAARRGFWERFTALAFHDPRRPPEEADRDSLLAGLDDPALANPAGRVTLVGAGPGDPDLLTLAAVRAMQAADIILHDDLVSAEVLELARREARRMLVGKTGHGPSCRQSDINDLMVRLAQSGKRVVRLKSGDPAVFGRATEEIAACRAAGVPVAIVPGVTAAQAAAASLGVSLTERKVARRLQYITGHAGDGRLPEDIAWPAVADPTATTVLYMPRRTLALFAERALAAGLPPETPAVAMTDVSRPGERRIAGTIATLAGEVADGAQAGPMLVLVGEALRQAATAAECRAGSRTERLSA
jgi:uroporphyrin-III C-methyltransferase/precorrin-2 dehydrogenase/sirohydrochlorin ferrochelatase